MTCLIAHSPLLHLMPFFHHFEVHFCHQVTLVVIREGEAPQLNQTKTGVVQLYELNSYEICDYELLSVTDLTIS